MMKTPAVLSTSRRRWLESAATAVGVGAAWQALPALAARPALGADTAAAHALNRLGFGPRPGDLAAVAADPQAWVERQLQPAGPALPDTLTARLREGQIVQADPIAQLRQYVDLIAQNNQAANAQAAEPAMSPPANAAASQPASPGAPVGAAPATGREPATPLGRFLREVQAPAVESRLLRALESPWQLQEVMVDFWFNHFNVFLNKNFMRVLVGHYEHHAIRPYAMGRFGDLLRATAHHPAMLYYLDNWLSVGERSGVRGRGLNENYARELMELHTLGVDGGYTQADVTELARILTGWTLVPPRAAGRPGVPEVRVVAPGQPEAMPGFWFNPRVHDGGDKQWLGRRITARGKTEGDEVLAVLAAHPATARHIAYKLVQYFVADRPPPALVERIAQVFLAEDGQMVPVLRALLRSDEFWSPEHVGAKFKTPYHYALSAVRATGVTPQGVQGLALGLAGQGMPLYGCQTPDGWHNTEAAWLNPDGMSKRINLAAQLARGALADARQRGVPELPALFDTLGPLATPETRVLAREQSADPALAVALVLAGPGMMRR